MKRNGLDAIDIRILGAVQRHGQLSKTRLAEIVNLSPSPCWARLDKLKAAGLIRGYGAEIALERIADFTRVIVTVSLTHHHRADFDRFEAHIAKLDEITDCVATGGGMDYIMTVYVRSVAAFEALMAGLLDSNLGIDRYMTYFTTRTIKRTPPDLAKLCAVPASKRSEGAP
ncbi:MAG: Lrp/AsnC family transcriptional regulator [Roseovarius sp.]|nr:Lrp/AsnC family transcriptional regulator [Roseovarius sp.]